MQARRRLQQTSNTTELQETQQPLLDATEQQQSSIVVFDDDSSQSLHDDDDNKKYSSKGWNFRSLSNRIQITSSNAIRALITQPSFETETTSYGGYGQSISTATTDEVNNDILDELFSQKEEIVVMASRDRTLEFGNAIRSLQSRNISRAVSIKDPRKAQQVQSYSEFMMVAKYIGKNIASTYAKLEKLTLLARKKSLFDDRPQEIQELTYIIKGDLNALNQQIAKLQEISKEQRRSVNGKHLVSHSSNMVLALQSKLASMSTDFKQILEVRTENLKQQKTRRDQFSQGPVASGVSPAAAKHGSLLLSEENQISIDMPTDENRALIPRQQQTQTQQMLMYDESDNYVQQRAETMQNIESTIVELGGIFQQLAHMVKEQEEIVERIDTNVQDAEMNIDAAHSEILKYFQSVTKNRWLMIKIFGVLIFFFIFFVMFMA